MRERRILSEVGGLVSARRVGKACADGERLCGDGARDVGVSKRRIQVLTEQDIARMDAKRKSKNFFAFIRAAEADLSRFEPQAGKLSNEAQKRREVPLESFKSASKKGRGNFDSE